MIEISINEESQKRIRRKVKSDLYRSVDDVVTNALDLLDLHDAEMARERALISEAKRIMAENAAAGVLVPESEVFDEARRRNAEVTCEKRSYVAKQPAS
ncbi:MAG: hypothetical protein F4Z35_01820 [Dehalococcoidia bacterium]|nr:hypothetical protein [Dehalococcoidia bacterium]